MKKRTARLLGATLAGAAAGMGYVLYIRPWHLKWGASLNEASRRLPGDERVSHPKIESTRAITIHAPIEKVWSWIAQIGQGRGGFYSYDWLENIFGCEIQNADRIVPAWQQPKVGDMVGLHPKVAFSIAVVEPPRALILHQAIDTQSNRVFDPSITSPQSYINVSWAFLLAPVDEYSTRLLARYRLDYQPNNIVNNLLWRVLEPAQFIMERKMLMGIKARAELDTRLPAGGAIDELLLDYDSRIYHEIFIPQPRQAVWNAMMTASMADLPFFRLLMALRSLGSSERGEAEQQPILPGLREMESNYMEEQTCSLLLQAIAGRFWQPDGGFVALPTRDAFLNAAPDLAQAVTAYRLEDQPGGTIFSIETRVKYPADPIGAARLRWYWPIVGRLGASMFARGLLSAVAFRAQNPTQEPPLSMNDPLRDED